MYQNSNGWTFSYNHGHLTLGLRFLASKTSVLSKWSHVNFKGIEPLKVILNVHNYVASRFLYFSSG